MRDHKRINMANDRVHTDAPRAATDVEYQSGGALVQDVLEELQWQMAQRDEISELRPPPDSASIETGVIGNPPKNEAVRQLSERSKENKMSTVRDKLYGMLAARGIQEVSAIRVVFENGDTVLVSSQDDRALDRTDPIQNLKLFQSAEAAALVGRLQNIKIKIYQEMGHKMPHIHIDYGRQTHVASFSIETGERIIKGTLDPKYNTEIKGWLCKHKAKLLTVWRDMQVGGDPKSLISELLGDA